MPNRDIWDEARGENGLAHRIGRTLLEEENHTRRKTMEDYPKQAVCVESHRTHNLAKEGLIM